MQKNYLNTLKKQKRTQELTKIKHAYLPTFLIYFGLLFLVMAYGPLFLDEVRYRLSLIRNQKFVLNDSAAQNDSVFARYLTSQNINLRPANTSFSIVIEKLGVSAPVVADVSVTSDEDYLAALRSGVAHASTSPYPSENPGNVYLFAHSAVNFWELGRYAGVFNLARKLEIGDTIHIFYKESDYKYVVVNKEVLNGWDTYPLTRSVVEPTLTLQTCDPPGTTLNRLIVTAKLEEVHPL